MSMNRLIKEIRANAETATKMADFYDKRWQGRTTSPGYQSRRRAEFIIRAFENIVRQSNLEILDFGCGRGWLAPFLAQWGQVTGVDFSAYGIAYANEHFGGYARFVLADATSPTLGISDQFDVVVCSEVIEHVENQYALLAQIHDFLKPGGYCVLTTPNGNLWDEYSRTVSFQDQRQPIEQWLTPARCARLFVDVGFKIVLHQGIVIRNKRFGPRIFRRLQGIRAERLFAMFGGSSLYHRVMLRWALYQIVVARKLSRLTVVVPPSDWTRS